MKKFSKEKLFEMDPIDVYNLVLEKKHIKRFPAGFWMQPEALNNATIIIRYLMEDRLKLSEDEIKTQLSAKIFKNNSLATMLQCCFNSSPYEAIIKAYPSKNYKPWEFTSVSKGYWDNIQNSINATKWLVEEKLKLSEEDLKTKLSAKIFKDNGLYGMLQLSFNSSPYEAISKSYPERNYKPWEFTSVAKGYWGDINNGIKATRWLIDEKLKLSEDELKSQLSKKLFSDNGLSCMVQYCFNGSLYETINKAYPNKYKKSDFINRYLY